MLRIKKKEIKWEKIPKAARKEKMKGGEKKSKVIDIKSGNMEN